MATLFTLAELMVFAMLLDMGLRLDREALRRVGEEPGILLRRLLSVLILVPGIAFVLVAIVPLPAAMATGLAVLAASPGAPMTAKRTAKGGGDLWVGSTLQLTSALLAVVVTPLWLALFYGSFDLLVGRVGPVTVLGQVAKVTFLPATLGFAVRQLAPRVASRVEPVVRKLAGVLFAIMALALLAALIFEPRLRGKLDVGFASVAVAGTWVLAGLAVGHALGGPGLRRRIATAIAGIARNLGLALYVLGLDNAGRDAVPMVLVYALAGLVLGLPYGLLAKRRLSELTTVAPPPAPEDSVPRAEEPPEP